MNIFDATFLCGQRTVNYGYSSCVDYDLMHSIKYKTGKNTVLSSIALSWQNEEHLASTQCNNINNKMEVPTLFVHSVVLLFFHAPSTNATKKATHVIPKNTNPNCIEVRQKPSHCIWRWRPIGNASNGFSEGNL